ncbi:hypothetical protein Tco_0586674 [Tanacetum coccineum]
MGAKDFCLKGYTKKMEGAIELGYDVYKQEDEVWKVYELALMSWLPYLAVVVKVSKKRDHVLSYLTMGWSKKHSKLNANSELICVKCNGCMLSDNHDLCVLNSVNDVRAKFKSIKKISKRKVWKPTGKVFTNIGYTWRPTGQTFTIVGNECPLTRITTTTEVPPRKPIALEIDTPKPVVTLVYSRKPMKPKTTDLVGKTKKNKSISANKRNPVNIVDPQFPMIYLPLLLIRNLEGDDLVTRPRGNNLYTLSIGDMMTSSLVSRHGLVRGLPNLKFEKDHLCSADAMGKSQKKPYKPKFEGTNQEKHNLLHMDLCGLMRVDPF